MEYTKLKLERPTGILEGRVTLVGGSEIFFWVFQLKNAYLLFTLYPSHRSIYHTQSCFGAGEEQPGHMHFTWNMKWYAF